MSSSLLESIGLGGLDIAYLLIGLLDFYNNTFDSDNYPVQ